MESAPPSPPSQDQETVQVQVEQPPAGQHEVQNEIEIQDTPPAEVEVDERTTETEEVLDDKLTEAATPSQVAQAENTQKPSDDSDEGPKTTETDKNDENIERVVSDEPEKKEGEGPLSSQAPPVANGDSSSKTTTKAANAEKEAESEPKVNVSEKIGHFKKLEEAASKDKPKGPNRKFEKILKFFSKSDAK